MCPNFRESASRWMDQYSNHWNAQEQCLRGCRCLAHSVCGWCFHPPLHSERMDGGWKLSIQFLHSIGRQIWQRCKSVPLQNSFAVVDSDFTLQTRPFCLHFSEQFLSWPIPTSRYKYDLRLETREFGVRTLGKPEQWSCDYPTRIDEPTTPRLTLAIKKLSTGANGQKEDAASFSCRRSTVSSLIDLPVSLMLDAQGYDLPIVAFGVRGTGHEYLFARAG